MWKGLSLKTTRRGRYGILSAAWTSLPTIETLVSVEGEAGRPAYDPHVLMSIWVYAYAKGIGSARDKKERMEHALRELAKIREGKTEEEALEARASMTDPDSRIMKQSDDGYAPSHNLQVSTDSAFGVIVAQGISQHPDDCKELTPALHRIEENAGKAPVQIVADGGYTTRENILAMDETDFIGSFEGRSKKRGTDHEFHHEKFTYDQDSNTYTCPQGKILRYQTKCPVGG